MHAGQHTVSLESVRAMVRRQFPQWRSLPVRPVESGGTVNWTFRLGEELAVRLPMLGTDPIAVQAELENEASAMAEFASNCPFPCPESVEIGAPDTHYPLPWSVQTWVVGADAVANDASNSIPFAVDLAALIGSLRRTGVAGRTYDGSGRGGHLPDHDAWMDECFYESVDLLDVPILRALWADLRTLPRVDSDVMSHRDITPPNVLVGQGRLTGVLDTGGFAPADPALDLVAGWHLLSATPRDVFRSELATFDNQWLRGMAWAFQQAMGLVWYYRLSNPPMSQWGNRTLDRIVAAAASW
ncbi:MAG: phosphotransferase [Nocardioides sp.]|uniref:phosphotransferase n=1 Tax=Nocardioides sp. TaxID=35761 RepID=UPI0039E256CC